MNHLTPHITALMEKLKFPREAAACFAEVFERIDGDTELSGAFDRARDAYLSGETPDIGQALPGLDAIGEKYQIRNYTLHFVFLLSLTEQLHEKYRERGISDEIYFDTMNDLSCKLRECIECKGYPGTFVASWDDGFFKLDRFALGRFQYEVRDFGVNGGFATRSGIIVPGGTRVLNMHIPSTGVPLTDEVRFDSYKKAYAFHKKLFPDGIALFVCGSWLLYPNHRKFLPENSNILKFLGDFQIISSNEKKSFGDDWRVFGRYAGMSPDKLPRDTGLRRAYADWLAAGNRSGDGYGIIAFDGEKIVT